MPESIVLGTAGWGISSAMAPAFDAAGSNLSRYAGRLTGVEINSSFYRPHRRATYERWAASVPAGFRFAVKLPKAISHEARLAGCAEALDRFAQEIGGLGPKLGPVLVQLPPSLAFAPEVAGVFFGLLHERLTAPTVCEPRHASWFTGEAEALLSGLRVARVAADPAPVAGAGKPGGWSGLAYVRLHGAPRIYYSDYDETALQAVAARLALYGSDGRPVWCIFDNTAAGHALGNAVRVVDLLKGEPPPGST